MKNRSKEKEAVITHDKTRANMENKQLNHETTSHDVHQPQQQVIEKTEGETKDETEWKTQPTRRNNQNRQREHQTNPTNYARKASDDLQAASKKAWLYIGKLKDNTTPDNVKKYMEKKGIQGNIICEELQTQGDNKAFKIGFPFNYIRETEQPEFWPQGIIARRFNFRFQRTNRDKGTELY